MIFNAYHFGFEKIVFLLDSFIPHTVLRSLVIEIFKITADEK
jgi:hypothetical protein